MYKIINFAFEKFQPAKCQTTVMNPTSLRNGLSSIFNKPNPKNEVFFLFNASNFDHLSKLQEQLYGIYFNIYEVLEPRTECPTRCLSSLLNDTTCQL
jgi:hypothetical protein